MSLSVKYFEKLKQLVKLLEHACIGAQILVLLAVFLCSLSVILAVFHSHMLDFMNPFFDLIKNWTTSMFGTSIKSTHPDIDGRLVLFVVFGIVLAFFISQIKMALHSFCDVVHSKMVKTKIKVQEDFNKQLKNDIEEDIMSQSHFLMAVQIRIKSVLKDNIRGDAPTPEEMEATKVEIITKFFDQVKLIKGLRFSKDNDILLLSSNNINNFDEINTGVGIIIEALRVEYKAKKINIRTRLAVTVYKMTTPMITAYKSIKPLLELNALNDLLCFGNFKNRYELVPNRKYNIAVKGKYDLNTGHEETIWSVVKKV